MSDSYLTLFVNSAFAADDLLAPLTLLLLFLARFLPIIALSPFFGARILPNPVKMAFAISMFIIFLPQLLLVITKPLPFNLQLVFYMLKEIFIGFCMGFLISIPFSIVQSAGIFVDHQRGGASLMVNDPTIQNQSSPLGLLFNQVMIVIFFSINGPFLFMDAIVTSYQILPPDQFISPIFFNTSGSFFLMQQNLFQQILTMTIQLAGPALIAILMTDTFLGIANRLAPQVQITFLGMPLKSLLALLVICVGWKLMTAEFIKQAYHWIHAVIDMVKMFKPVTI